MLVAGFSSLLPPLFTLSSRFGLEMSFFPGYQNDISTGFFSDGFSDGVLGFNLSCLVCAALVSLFSRAPVSAVYHL